MTDQPKPDAPAFPVTAGQQVYATGMSLRSWFAGQVLAQINPTAADAAWMEQHGAAMAYRIADAMLAAESDHDTRIAAQLECSRDACEGPGVG
jgi:hypothetical protein